VIECNKGDLNFEQAIKKMTDSVHGAGELVAMHILAVLTLTGNCINRDFLRMATLGQGCRKQLREKIFPNEMVTSGQMKTGLKGVVRKMGLSPFMVENLLCEALRQKPGYDTFHPSQSIFFLEDCTDNIVCVNGDKVEFRTVEDDMGVLDQLPTCDGVIPCYPWWKAPKGAKGIHMWFVKLCKGKKIDPTSLIIRPYLNAKVNQSPQLIWRHYVELMEKNDAKGNGKMEATGTKHNQKKHIQKKRPRAGG